MIKLEFKIDCLDGKYYFDCACNEELIYNVDTSINSLNNIEGQLSDEDKEKFLSLINEAQIEKWDRNYTGISLIDDGIRWSVKYLNNDKEYVSDGVESYEPYSFRKLIEAIMICDKQLSYFGW